MIILEPLPIAAIAGTGVGANYLLTPDPKEVWAGTYAGGHEIDIDLGALAAFDTIFLGFTNLPAAAEWYIYTATGPGTGLALIVPPRPARAADSLGPRHHCLARLAAPVEARYLRITVSSNVAPVAGVVAVGKAFQAPFEFGSGRTLIDTGAKEALIGGGFGLGDGVVKAQLRWSFVDLSPAKRRALWALTYRRGERKPIIVVEELGEDAGLGEEIHYGLFDRFQAYERDDPGQTRWALSMTEWA